jgi:molecular chaperone DnaK
MVEEAKLHEEEDKKAREAVEKRNKLDGMILEVEKNLTEHRAKLSEADATAIDTALEAAKAALKEHENNAQELDKATDALMQASYKLAEVLYAQKDAEQPGQPADAPAGDAQQAQSQQGPIDAEMS